LRTQQGNNNAWCQDNDVSWLDWRLAEKNAEHLRFVKEMIALRKQHPALRRRRFFEGRGVGGYHPPDVASHAVAPGPPRLSAQSRTLALTIDGRQTGRVEKDADLCLIFSAWERPLTFTVPPSPNGKEWRRVVDTALPSPDDIVPEGTGPEVRAFSGYRVAP